MKRHHKRRRGANRRGVESAPKKLLSVVLTDEQIKKREKYLAIFVVAVLIAFGAYLSILYYGHKIVPCSDFMGFYRTGRQIANFQLPTSYKRAPVTGLLQYMTSFFMKSPYPHLRAGWMVNAILNPLSLVLLWLIGKEMLGKSGKWLAILVIVNPWTLSLLIEPIAETTMLFFVLLTIYLIFKRTSWCYLAGMAATMVRYEAATLVIAAFLVDMIYSKNKKQRLKALLFAFLAAIPLMLWMYGTLKSGTKGTTHYFNVFSFSASKEFKDMGADKTGIIKHFNIIWSVGFRYLFGLPLDTDREVYKEFFNISKFLVSSTFILGLVFAAIRKNWKIMVLLCFLAPYVLVHAYYPYPIARFHAISFWIVLAICLYGIVELWKFADKGNRIPRPVVCCMQVLTISCLAVWLFKLLSTDPRVPTHIQYANKISPQSSSIAFVTFGVVLALAIVPVLLMRFKGAMHALTVVFLFAVMIVSNQLGVASLMQTGKHDSEFKVLADWYTENAKPGEKMATSMTPVVSLYVSNPSGIVNYRNIKSTGPADFANKLHKKGIKYIAWDSRLGLAPTDPYYKLYHLEKIKTLMHPQSQGPYKFIKRIENGRRFVNIFELQMPPSKKPPKPKQ
ncbi:MAG: glycosyltransferase family 39 protein [Planctomycetes bacterium]|nr:glycosyltransferase family 39 protein [Planctomycetota bacterium]